MANTLAPIIPKLLAGGLMALRTTATFPRVVNRDYGRDAADFGDVVNVPIPSAIASAPVVPGPTPPAPGSTPAKTVPINLDQWEFTEFYLTDKEMKEINLNRHFFPMQASEAVQGLAETVNTHIGSFYTGVYGFHGTPGTTPFATDNDARQLRKVLHSQRCPKANRRAVIDLDADASALGLDAFKHAEKSTDRGVIIEGEIGRKFGFDWFGEDSVPTHTAGTQTGAPTASAASLGAESVTLNTVGGEAVNLLKGDIITFSNHTQTYAVLADVTIGASAAGAASIAPGLVAALSGGETFTVKATHVVNLGFHRDAFAFANRELVDSVSGFGDLGSRILGTTDSETGIALRLEVTRQHKQIVWQYDMLWGSALVRAALAARLAG